VIVEANGSVVAASRHLVVATRVNPNAARRPTRRIQVRAWNRTEEQQNIPPSGVADVAAAHLFGLFNNLRLRENARAIALSVQIRSEANNERARRRTEEQLHSTLDRAQAEWRDRTEARKTARGIAAISVIEASFGAIEIEIAEPVFALAHKLQQAETGESAASAIADADQKLDAWRDSTAGKEHEPERRALATGIDVHIRRDSERR
jgi:hypothetical protein